MFKPRKHRHALTMRHIHQVARRPLGLREQLHSIWAMTWKPGGRRGSFQGQLFRPLGSAILMVQASYPLGRQKEGIGLLGLAAQIDPHEGRVSYNQVRLRHDFHRVPYVGARGPVLDPSPDARGGRGKGSWVQLALEVDRLRERAAERGAWLPEIPILPDIFFAYHREDAARFEVTAALERRAIAQLSVSWTGSSLQGLRGLDEQVSTAQRAEFENLSAEVQQRMLRKAWDAAFIGPDDPMNETGLWLLPQELSTDVYPTARIYEYFGRLVGAHVFNPARKLGAVTTPNPAVEIATAAGIDLVGDLASLATTREGAPEFQAVEERLIELVPRYRQVVGASAEIGDQDLLDAICRYELPVVICPAVQDLPEAEQIRRVRERLAQHVSDSCEDADILEAVQNPSGPLFAAGLCRVQTLHRDPSIALSERLCFSPERLGRERVEAQFWHDQPAGLRGRNAVSLAVV